MIRLSLSESSAAAEAARILQTPGGVVLLPTETVYGLVCRADDAAGIRRIYDLKDRDASKPLAWFVADWRTLPKYGLRLEGWPEKLAEAYVPGPITIIAPRLDGGGTVGFRTPDHPFVLSLLKMLPFPLASTSANRSGRPNARSLEEALSELAGEPELAIDGGVIAEGALASTVVDATGAVPRVLRPGPIKI